MHTVNHRRVFPKSSVHPATRSAWGAWLAEHHADPAGVWLVTYKRATRKPRVGSNEAVEEALCFGWIDSKPDKLDDERSLRWFAPRKRGTGWSRANKERVERAIAAGLMAASGWVKIEAAKADGSWSALDAVEALQIPDNLRHALARYESAALHFEAFPRSVKRSILEWILNAKKAETRSARIAETALLANDNQRRNQWRGGQKAA